MERMIEGLPVATGSAWAGVNYFCTTWAGGGKGVAPHDTLNLGRAGDDPDTVAENRRRLCAALPAEPCGCVSMAARWWTPTPPTCRTSLRWTPVSPPVPGACWP